MTFSPMWNERRNHIFIRVSSLLYQSKLKFYNPPVTWTNISTSHSLSIFFNQTFVHWYQDWYSINLTFHRSLYHVYYLWGRFSLFALPLFIVASFAVTGCSLYFCYTQRLLIKVTGFHGNLYVSQLNNLQRRGSLCNMGSGVCESDSPSLPLSAGPLLTRLCVTSSPRALTWELQFLSIRRPVQVLCAASTSQQLLLWTHWSDWQGIGIKIFFIKS